MVLVALSSTVQVALQSIRYAAKLTAFALPKSLGAAQMTNLVTDTVCPDASYFHCWYFVGSVSDAPRSDFFSNSPGSASRPGSKLGNEPEGG